jgi:peptidyl-prolyl cis-trans isomerase B (cyclophilin B)
MKINPKQWLLSVVCCFLLGNFLLGGCAQPAVNSSDAAKPPATATAQPQPLANNTATPMDNYTPRLNGNAVVELTINGSPVLIEVDGKDAPITAGNFVDLVERGFYNGLTFHRVVKDPQPFVAQGGDPKGTGTGNFIDPATKQPRYVPLEIKVSDQGQEKILYGQSIGQQSPKNAASSVVLKHKKGAIAMARSQQPDSASSQFYFALSDLEFLDGDYAVFGYVTKGLETVEGIKQGDRIQSAKVISGSENLKK